MHYPFILFICILLLPIDTWGQSTSVTDFIQCIESQNGADNLLINGRPYLPAHTQAEGHPYFQTNEWKPGTVYINGIDYPADHLKYNLHNDQLIIKHERSSGVSQKVILSKVLIDSFQIGDHVFVNRNLILREPENIAYLEKIFAGKLSFFRYQEKVLGPITTFAPHGQFSYLKDVFYLLQEDSYHEINRRRDLLARFPDHKREIKKYMRKNSMKWRKMTKAQFFQLLKFCDERR